MTRSALHCACWAALLLLCANSAAASDLSGTAVLVSDYRGRGLSLSDGAPAIQASALLEDDSGAYVELWGSSLGKGVDSELDVSVGYGRDLSEALALDFYVTYVVYPGDTASNYVEATAAASVSRGNASASIGLSHAPSQRGTRDENGHSRSNSYAFMEGAIEVTGTPLTVNAGLGYERGAFDFVERGGKWDWTLGAEAQLSRTKLGIAYVGSNAAFGNPHGIVGTVALGW